MPELGRLLVVSHPAVLEVNQEQYVALRDLGWDVTLVIPSNWKHEYRSDDFAPRILAALTDRVLPFRVVMAGRAQRHFYLVRASAIIRQVDPDVMFLEQEPFSLSAYQWGMAASRLRVPFGVQAAENLDRRMPAIARVVRSRVLRTASFVAARSPAAADLVRRWGAKGRIQVIPHPVPAWPLPPREISGKQGFVIGFAGRLVPEKGVADLLDAFQTMSRQARLLLVGNGPLLESVSGRPGVDVWADCPHEQIAEAYRRMDVLVLPSRRTPQWEEQFGRVLVEALHCGVPVIGSATGEIPWVVESTGGGWLFREGDVDGLAALLDQMAADPDALAERAKRGQRAVAERFSQTAVAIRMSAILADVQGHRDKPKLTFVAHDVGGPGGMESVYGELIRRLAGSWDIQVLSVTLEESLRALVTWRRVRVLNRPAPVKFALFFVLAGLKLARWRDGIVNTCGAILPNRIDVASVHLCHAGLLHATGRRSPKNAPMARRLNTGATRLLASLAERWCYRASRLKMFHAVSTGVADELQAHFPGVAVTVIPNGVDIGSFHPDEDSRMWYRSAHGASDDALVALFVGGDWDHKGLEIVIEAVASARRMGVDVRLWVVGKGDIARFRVRADEQGILESVRFFGVRDDIEAVLSAADVFLLPSTYETFSLVAHEAAASGLPVLSTSVHGVVDLVGDDEAGFVLGVDPTEWAQALVKLAKDASLRSRLGCEGRRRVSRMGWAEMAKNFDLMAKGLASPQEHPM